MCNVSVRKRQPNSDVLNNGGRHQGWAKQLQLNFSQYLEPLDSIRYHNIYVFASNWLK